MSSKFLNFIEVDHVDKIFPLPGGDRYIALKNIELKIKKGEFISLIGHSGCGKSTLLNMISGLDRPTFGGVVVEGKEVDGPGPDRMVVFQNYSLLPWLTVRQNIGLAVNRVLEHLPKGERQQVVDEHIELVGLKRAANRRPGELSGGMKQRVAIARALAIQPKVLLLDEPFGALDALTRGNLQEKLLEIVQEKHITCVMVTHDVDEALLLSDRVVMLTTGPEAHIGRILEVPIDHPRERLEVVNHPEYYNLRHEIVYFLNQQKRVRKGVGQISHGPEVVNQPEKATINVGLLPLNDSAPFIVAQELGLFKKHGLEKVNLVKESSWQAIADGVTTGELDAAQMVAGMPIALTVGLHNKASIPMVSAMVLSRNGNAITLSKEFLDAGIKTPQDLKEHLQNTPDRILTFGVVYPASMENLLLRYWLASGGIDPDQDVTLTILSPEEMVDNLRSGAIDGFCVGDPWNSQAVAAGLGYVIATDLDIWAGHPEKVLGAREDWVAKNPKTHIALVKALLEACEYCDDRRNRTEITKILGSSILSIDPAFSQAGFADVFDYGDGQTPAMLPRFHQFHNEQANCPARGEGLWILTQLARWGYMPFPKNWLEITERVRRPDLFGEACRQLGWPDIEGDRQTFKLMDGMVFTPNDPVSYIKRFSIHRELTVSEIQLQETIANV
ncbi:nitrate ABC transporter ATP-binding protein [[Limnothrix rosea] IAM M-220]|uniref:ABC transporter ATP-binding/substrate-binding protein n=1 Tax=[Limnothrix rosea] IAM M-220 TaxID=454133 RepID=UPI00095C38A5|nr:nitrate ABC transporter ATP-binding protein [[Limnothrix rosea] IAM M-220]OKH13152.1 bacitracin ABC transporter ATP-binding protein [[Limnothrix rosea] IAM M-220]